MRKAFLLFFCLLAPAIYSNAQQISGTIYDASTGAPMPYVSAGLIGKSIGAVSDRRGEYTLSANGEDLSGIIRFSYLGYEPYDITLSELMSGERADIRLSPLDIPIERIIVRPAEYRSRTIGNRFKSKAMSLVTKPENRGFEIGVVMNIKKRAILQTVLINITSSTYPDMIFRLNIYEVRDGSVGRNILTEPIYGYCPYTDSPRT